MEESSFPESDVTAKGGAGLAHTMPTFADRVEPEGKHQVQQ